MAGLLKSIMLHNSLPTWLIITLIASFLFRIPSFFEPYWYGDEAIYLTLGEGIRQGLLLYRDIHDNKPPLLYLLAAIAGNVFWLKVILAFWMAGTIYLFWRLCSFLFEKKQKIAKYATIIFALLTSIPLLEGNIANAEIFMILPVIAAFLLLLRPRRNTTQVFLAGILIAISTLFKVPAVFDTGAIIVLWMMLLTHKQKDLLIFLKNTSVLFLGIAVPILLTIIFFYINGALKEYITAALAQNIGYLSSWQGGGFSESPTANRPLITRGIILLVTIIVLTRLYLTRRISLSFLFVGSWFAFSLFAALLSERPYPHYLIQLLPSFSILLSITLTSKTKEQFLPYPLLAMLGAALIFYKFYYWPVFSYYQNFIEWASGQKDKTAYFQWFDPRTARNYEIADFITKSVNPGDSIFVWGDNPEIYALTEILPPGRYVAAYHIRDFNGYRETIKSLKSHPPHFIITTMSTTNFADLNDILAVSYFRLERKDGATIWLLK